MLFALCTTPSERLQTGRDHCPWQMFLAAYFMKHDKGFAKPEDTISDLSGVKYIFKCAMFYERMQRTSTHLDFDK